MRKPSIAELIVQALLLALIGVVIWDLVQAVGAVACQNVTELDAGGCYPWGWEGPFSDFWHLRNRELYLVSRALDIFVFALAFSMPFAVTDRRYGIFAMLIIPIAGSVVLKWLPHLMGW
jgi:hypothetical protein